MSLSSSRAWTRRLRRDFAFLLIRGDWLTRTTESIRRRPRLDLTFAFPGSQFWLLVVSALFDTAWLAAWSLVAIRYHSCLAVFLASFPVLKWLLLLVARQPAASSRLEQTAAQAVTEPSSVSQQSPTTTESPEFISVNPRQHWVGEHGIVSHEVSGAVQK